MTAKRWLILTGLIVGVVAVVLTAMAWRISPRIHAEVVRALSERLDSQVTLEDLDVRLFPRPHVSGRGLVIRHQGRTDIPPLIVVGAFSGGASWGGALARHLSEVTLEGLEISIPPRRRADMPSLGGGADAPATDADAGSSADTDEDAATPPFSIARVIATNARLSIMPRQADKDPRVFDIFSLLLEDLTFVSPSRYTATLTNPIPFGRIETEGSFGPWARGEPSATPLDGVFTFDADLGTIKGIAGHLDAEGRFGGILDRIAVSGRTSTPDFSIPKLKAQALPLETTFEAVVDGTNGDVRLERVESTLADSHFTSTGDIVGTKGIRGKRVVLEVRSDDARMEDVLGLTVRATPPPMTGHLTLETSFDLPQGEADVLDKLLLSGKVAIKSGRFTSDNVQDKIDELSRRGRGRPEDQSIDNVVSNLATAFTLKDGVITLRGLTYAVQGATVAMDGTYALESGVLDFAGVARLRASVSETQTGFKHFLLKAVDPLFRKGGAGTRLAIKVEGTVDAPKFGVEIGRTLKGK